GRASGDWRLRTYQRGNDFAERHGRAAHFRLAVAFRGRYRGSEPESPDSRSHRGCADRRTAAPAGGSAMIPNGRPAKILLIDSNVYFSKKLGDALKREGFEVISSTQAAFALTTLEYDLPAAIVCATNLREMGALE